MFKFVVLGSAAALPSKKHLPSCFALKHGSVYLFECCEGCQRQMMKYGVSYFKAKVIFISHLHADAFLGVFGLVQTLNLMGRTEELRVFGPKGTKKFLESALALNELKPFFKVIVKDANAGIVLEEDDFTVKAFPVKHNAPAVGYALEENEKTRFDEKKAKAKGIRGKMFTEISEKGRIRVGNKTVGLEEVTYKEKGVKVVFSGDTRQTERIEKESAGADLLIHDACFVEEHRKLAEEKFHSTAAEAAETAKKAKVKWLLLTHASNRYDDRSILLKEAKKTFENSLIAEEGLELEV